MGLFGGSKSSSSSGSGQKWAQPYAKSAASDIQSNYNTNQDQQQAQTDSLYSLASQTLDQYNQGNENVDAAQNYNTAVLNGEYLNNNSYLQGQIDQTKQSVTDEANSQFSLAGRYGSGAHTGVLTSKLADAENDLRYQNYSDEMTRMDNAANSASSIAQGQYTGLSEALTAATTATDNSTAQDTAYANALSALMNGGTSTSKTSNGIGSLLQGAGSIASSAAMLSDPRLKSNVVKVGEMEDGLGIYEYDIFDRRERGVMADEVEKLRPWALGPELAGYRTVHYEEL